MTTTSVNMEIKKHTKDDLSFLVDGVDVSIVNSMRRACMSNIETLVFRGFPHEENKINITKNTTKFNNEYLKHRISCLPIGNNKSTAVTAFNDPTKFNTIIQSYKLVLNKKNNEKTKRFVTTDDFEMYDKNTNEVVKDFDIQEIFPHDEITDEPILLLILYPNFNQNEETEEITLELEFDKGSAYENSCWNVVSKCCYENKRNEEVIHEISEKMRSSGKSNMDVRDFELLDGQRIYVKDMFEFYLEGIGIYTSRQIAVRGIEYILKKLNILQDYISQNSQNEIQSRDKLQDLEDDNLYAIYSHEELRNYIVLKLKEDDYTIGKLIENHLYKEFRDKLEFVGFKKMHTTEKEAYIYIKYMSDNEDSVTMSQVNIQIYQDLMVVIKKIAEIYNNIISNIPVDK